jgi:hypothetical protein
MGGMAGMDGYDVDCEVLIGVLTQFANREDVAVPATAGAASL